MTLARKDFIAITQGIRLHMVPGDNNRSVQTIRVAMNIAQQLALANPTSFNRTAFLVACGVLKEVEAPATQPAPEVKP